MVGIFHNVGRRFRVRPLRTGLTLLQVALGALALTVAVTTYLGSFVDRSTERFILTAGSREGGNWGVFAEEYIPDIMALAPAIERMALYGSTYPYIVYNGEQYRLRSIFTVTPAYFEMAGIELTQGSFFTAQEYEGEEAVALVSDSIAEDLFGNAAPIGQQFILLHNPSLPGGVARTYTVIGTFRYKTNRLLSFDNRPAHMYVPIWSGNSNGGSTSHYMIEAKPSQGELAREQAMAAANIVGRDIPGIRKMRDGERVYIEELSANYRYTDSFNPNVLIFGLFGIIALIIGAIGIFSSAVVDIAERNHEIGVRRAVGASRGRIGREFMGEAGMLALIGGVLGVALAAALLPLLSTLVGDTLFLGVSLGFHPLIGVAVVVVVVLLSAVLGLLPALQAGRARPAETLGEV